LTCCAIATARMPKVASADNALRWARHCKIVSVKGCG
jgi:hypothetical protein